MNVMAARTTGSINFQLYHSKWTTLIQVLAHDLKVGQDIHQGVRRKKKEKKRKISLSAPLTWFMMSVSVNL